MKTYIHPVTGCRGPYVPMGRFVHVPPPFPRSDWANNFGNPWWTDTQYLVGILTAKTRQMRIVNMSTLQEQVIEVCAVHVYHSCQLSLVAGQSLKMPLCPLLSLKQLLMNIERQVSCENSEFPAN